MRSRNSLALALVLVLAACAGHRGGPSQIGRAPEHAPVSDTPVKIGPPYQVAGQWYVPADTRAYDEIGLASWYGPGFRGGRTANGELYLEDGVSGAHKTLPLPCYVEVTALATGRTILVRINDRGPFAGDRIIDLSQGAARQLGIERLGLARVRVRRVEPTGADKLALRSGRAAPLRPDATPTMLANLSARFAVKPPLPAATSRTRMAEVGAVLAALQPTPTPLFIDVPVPAGQSTATRLSAYGPLVPNAPAGAVRLGPFADGPSARSVLAQLVSGGYAQARLVPAPADPIQTAGNRTSVTP